MTQEPAEIIFSDMDDATFPGGCAEPVIHVAGLVIVLILIPTAAR